MEREGIRLTLIIYVNLLTYKAQYTLSIVCCFIDSLIPVKQKCNNPSLLLF